MGNIIIELLKNRVWISKNNNIRIITQDELLESSSFKVCTEDIIYNFPSKLNFRILFLFVKLLYRLYIFKVADNFSYKIYSL